MTAQYWYGVATPFAITATATTLWLLLRATVHALHRHGWFITIAPPITTTRIWHHGRVDVHRRAGLHHGTYRPLRHPDLPRPGSRWIALGHLTIGRTSHTLHLTEPPPLHERTPR